jgi:hypothetical protein
MGSVSAEVVRGKYNWGGGEFWGALLFHALTAFRALWMFGRYFSS